MLLLFSFGFAVTSNAQNIAFKSNLAEWATASPNLGIEVALWPKLTLDIDGLINPWKWDDRDNLYSTKSSRCWAVQPELRYWFCRKFFRSFIGLHGHYGEYDCGINKYNYDGSLYGAGLSYGYAIPLSKRWRFEMSVGVGWNHLDYEKTDRLNDYKGDVIYYDPVVSDKFGLTRAGISFVLIIG